MTTDLISQLETAFVGVDVTCDRVAPESVESAILEGITGPTVAAPIENVLLDHTNIIVDPTPRELQEAVTGITGALLAIADYGSIVLPTLGNGSELISLFVDRHVIVLQARDIVADITTALDGDLVRILAEGGDAVIATGPSATADMGSLVQGAHGPQEVHVILVEEEV